MLQYQHINMNTISSAKKVSNQEDSITIPRKEYEALIDFKEIEEFDPTNAQKKALAKAENNFQKGKIFSYNELVKKLGLSR